MRRVLRSRLALSAALLGMWCLTAARGQSVDQNNPKITTEQRLAYRMTIGDWHGARELAMAMDNENVARSPDQQALIDGALFQSALVLSTPESAVLPFLRLQMNDQAPQVLSVFQDGQLWTADDAQHVISPRLPPVFFDESQAASALRQLRAFAEQHGDRAPAGWRVYAAGLAWAQRAGLDFRADEWFTSRSAIGTADERHVWGAIFSAAQQLSANDSQRADIVLQELSKRDLRPVESATLAYFHAEAQEQAAAVPRADTLRTWLQLAADWRAEYPDLAAAGMWRAANIARQLGWDEEADTLFAKLAFSYPRTFHGKMSLQR